jgi:hypothetical protein
MGGCLDGTYYYLVALEIITKFDGVEGVGVQRIVDRAGSLRCNESDLLLPGNDIREIGVEGPIPVPIGRNCEYQNSQGG